MPETFDYHDIEILMSHFIRAGITSVRVISVNDELTCSYCKKMDDTLIPVESMLQFAKRCTSDLGCRCEFYPVTGETNDQ